MAYRTFTKKLTGNVSSWLGLSWRSVRNGYAFVVSCITSVPSVIKRR